MEEERERARAEAKEESFGFCSEGSRQIEAEWDACELSSDSEAEAEAEQPRLVAYFVSFAAAVPPSLTQQILGEAPGGPSDSYASSAAVSVDCQRYPLTDYGDFPFPAGLEAFVMGVRDKVLLLHSHPSPQPPRARSHTLTHSRSRSGPAHCPPRTSHSDSDAVGDSAAASTETGTEAEPLGAKSDPWFFSFVLTDELGLRTYVSVVNYLELVTSVSVGRGGARQTVDVRAARALCLLSRYPFFSLFRGCLQSLFELSTEYDTEKLQHSPSPQQVRTENTLPILLSSVLQWLECLCEIVGLLCFFPINTTVPQLRS